MLSEHIKKDAEVKLYLSGKELEDFSDRNSILCGRGTIRKIVSETEIEIDLEEEENEEFQKDICYELYIFLAKEVFLCSSYYKLSYPEEEGNIVLMEIVSPLERVHRRRHHRVSCHSRIRYEVISPEDVRKMLKEGQMPAGYEAELSILDDSLVELGGGGLRFTSGKQIAENDFLSVQFEIIEKKKVSQIQAVGQVVYSGKLRNEENAYDIRMKFIGLDEETKKRIICFVFQLERDSINVRWQQGGGFA